MLNNDILSREAERFSAEKGSRAPEKQPKKEGQVKQGPYTEEWLRQALEDAGVPVYYTKEDAGATEFYVPCPNEENHTGDTNIGDSYVKIYNGWPVFHCWHKHCETWKFPDFAQAYGIEYKKKTGKAPDKETHYFSSFYEWKEYTDGSTKATKVIDVNICDWICENYTFFVMGDLPYFMNDYHCYEVDDGGARMKRLIQSCILPHLCKDHTISSIYKMILYQDKRKNYDELNQYPVEYVPFLNGFYDPINNNMVPIYPENYVINMIPHEYNPNKTIPSPVFNELLLFQVPEDDARELWLEYCGTCFNRDMSGQKWMIIRGDGGTGKSTQINVLAECIGLQNISNETLQGLNERFNATNLFGKFVNLCADISSEDMKKIDVLKKITGEDRNGVKHEKKGKDCFFFTPFCKLLFSANEIPLNRDEKSNAFYRRLLITVMDKKPDKVDRNLQHKLSAEIDGIIQRYMEALRRFYHRGGYYPESLTSNHEVQRLRRSADSVIAFFDEELEQDPEGQVERGDLYKAYTDYCKREDRLFPVTKNKLFDRLRDMGVQEKKVNGKRFFIGVQVADGGFMDDSDEDIPFWDK